MKMPFVKSLLMALTVVVLLSAASAQAADVVVTGVVGSGGTINGDANVVLTNGAPGESTVWNMGGTTTLWWREYTQTLTETFDEVYTLDDVLVSADCNDDYLVEYSLDNLIWTTLFTIDRAYGDTLNGMDTMSSVSGDLQYVPPIDFAPVQARYARIRATGGDLQSAVGELRFQGTAVPEPGSFSLVALGVLGVLCRRIRRSGRA